MSRGGTPSGGGAAPRRLLLTVAAAIAAVFVLLLWQLPAFEATAPGAGGLFRLGCQKICHQLPPRCLEVAGISMPVCARCFGLYIGGALALVAAALAALGGLRPRAPRWLLLAVLPSLVDALLVLGFGIGLPNVPRLVVSIPAGAALGYFLAVGIEDLDRMLRRA